jgi:hypothetical protein
LQCRLQEENTQVLHQRLFSMVLIITMVSREMCGADAVNTDDVIEDIQQMARVTRSAWAYVDEKRHTHGVEIDKIADKATAQARAATTDAGRKMALRQFAADLWDGHASVTFPDDFACTPLSVEFTEVREGIAVAKVTDPESAVHVGDVLLRVNDQSVQDVMRTLEPLISSAGHESKRHVIVRRMNILLRILSPTATELLLSRPDGSTYKATFGEQQTKNHSFSVDIGRRELKRLTGDVVLARLPTFACFVKWWKDDSWSLDPSAKNGISQTDENESRDLAKSWIDQVFSEACNANGLILDLRGNSGGNDGIASYIAQHLVEGEFLYYTLQFRLAPEWNSMEGQMGWTEKVDHKVTVAAPPHGGLVIPKDPKISVFTGKMAVLVDGDCSSATAILLACLRHYRPDIKLIGRTVVGTLGGGNLAAILDRTKARFCLSGCRGWGPEGDLIEGRVFSPDIPVRWSTADLIRNVDPDIDAALECLSR